MDQVFGLFRSAYLNCSGYELSETLVPGASSEQLELLRAFYRGTNSANVKNDVRYNILYDTSTSLRLSAEEVNAWVDVYVAYWNAIGDIIRAEGAGDANLKVCLAEGVLRSTLIRFLFCYSLFTWPHLLITSYLSRVGLLGSC